MSSRRLTILGLLVVTTHIRRNYGVLTPRRTFWGVSSVSHPSLSLVVLSESLLTDYRSSSASHQGPKLRITLAMQSQNVDVCTCNPSSLLSVIDEKLTWMPETLFSDCFHMCFLPSIVGRIASSNSVCSLTALEEHLYPLCEPGNNIEHERLGKALCTLCVVVVGNWDFFVIY